MSLLELFAEASVMLHLGRSMEAELILSLTDASTISSPKYQWSLEALRSTPSGIVGF
jgi:hypothetical protein